ncbi:MAG: type II toxin-antitoxin system PemK/MazF family toxin [Pseudonocardiaceae bacterium]
MTGEVWLAALDPVAPGEQGGTRPVLVVSTSGHPRPPENSDGPDPSCPSGGNPARHPHTSASAAWLSWSQHAAVRLLLPWAGSRRCLRVRSMAMPRSTGCCA